MTQQELYWLAGILEGEGCFTVAGNSIAIVLAMTDLDVVQRAAKLMYSDKITVSQQGEYKPIYRVTVRGSRAATLAKLVRPIMGERRAGKIDELLNVYNTITARSTMRRIREIIRNG